MPKRQYSSKRSQAARKIVAAQLPAPCFRCKRIVTADMKWEADHMISRAEAEAMGMSEVETDLMVAPAHASCNHKAGATLGNQLRAKAKAKPAPRVIEKVNRPSLEAFFEEDTNTPASCHFSSLPDSAEDTQEAAE